LTGKLSIAERTSKLLNPMLYVHDLKEPRRERKNKLHSLSEIVMIALCAVLEFLSKTGTYSELP